MVVTLHSLYDLLDMEVEGIYKTLVLFHQVHWVTFQKTINLIPLVLGL